MDNNFYVIINTIKSQIENNLDNQLRGFDIQMENFYTNYKEFDTIFCML